jgi:hypothetical protein
MTHADDGIYLVWSDEHQGWWKAAERGYTPFLAQAGHYSRERAIQICTDALPGRLRNNGRWPEIPVRLTDALAVIERNG